MRSDIKEQVKKYSYQIGLYVRDEFVEKFDENAYKIINDIKENGKTATKEQWLQWIKDGKGNKDIQEYIAIFPNTPLYALNVLLSTGRTYQDTCIDLIKRDDIDDLLINKIISKANANTIDRIIHSIKYPNEHINPKVADIIATVVTEWLLDGETTKCDMAFFSALECTTKEAPIEKLLKSGIEIPEVVLNKIASNPNLSDSIRNEAFDRGCNFEELTNINSYMAKIIYESAIDVAIDDGTTSWDMRVARDRALNALNKISESGAMDDSVMIDMLNRIYEKDLTPYQSKVKQLTDALKQTKSSYIMDYIYDFSHKFENSIEWKKYLVDFPATSDSLKTKIINDAIEDYYEKYKKEGTAYRSTAYEKNDILFIERYLSDYDLGKSTYDKLFDFMEEHSERKRMLYELRTSFVSCPYISEELLDKINIDGKNLGFDEKQMFYSRINSDLKANHLSDYVKHITNAYRLKYTNVCNMYDIDIINKAKEICKRNTLKIKDGTIKEEFMDKLDVFDSRIRSIEFEESMKTRKRNMEDYYQGYRKPCEVYTYIDDLINNIEEKEAGSKIHSISR